MIEEPLHTQHNRALMEFQGSQRHRELKNVYWMRGAIDDVAPRWDTSSSSKVLNWEGSDDELSAARLVWIERIEILERLQDSKNCLSPDVYRYADDDKFLFILNLWKNDTALPPPLLLDDGTTLRKRDGFHRLCVSILTGSLQIPCWLTPDGL